MSSLLGFLKSAQVTEIEASAAKPRSGATKQRTPNPGIVALRVWKNGSVFPSQAAIDKFDLEYRTATIERDPLPLKGNEPQAYKNVYTFPTGTGNGLDVINSEEWPQFKGEGKMMFVAVVPKDAGKVDLFASTNYNEETGVPKTSVLDQGANTFGTQVLLPMLKDVYGIELSEEKEFVDILIFEELGEGKDAFNLTETFSKPILHVPKRVTRGENKGKSDYTRRENVKVYGFAPVEVIHPEQGAVAGTDEQELEQKDLTDATPEERAAYLNS